MSNKLAQRVHSVSTPPAGEDFLQQLRRVNGERWKAWAKSDDPDPLYMSNEFGGEAGEVQNVVKKLVRESRGWKGSRATVEQLGDEIADCIICLDSLARAYGLHLPEIISAKFNATSEANGFPHWLAAEPASHPCKLPAEPAGDEPVERDNLGRTDADLLRLIAKDHQRLAPSAHHSADTLREIADRMDLPATPPNPERKFTVGQRVTKTKGSSWTGRIVGFYSTAFTAIGYAVESEAETGSVQIYPEAALSAAPITASAEEAQ